MKVEEVFRVHIDKNWVEDVDTEEEVTEIIEDWINGIDYLEDEELDLVYESIVSRITIEFVVTDITDQMIIPSKENNRETKRTALLKKLSKIYIDDKTLAYNINCD